MCTVMVVDNRITTRNWLQECIQGSCIKTDKIVLCESYVDAMNYIAKNNVDIAITRLQKTDCTCIELAKAMHRRLIFSIVLGYGVCKDFNFLCNAVNSGVSRYLEDVFNKDKFELFLSEAYERYCSNKIKLRCITKAAGKKPETAYSSKMLKELVEAYSRNAITGNEKNIDEYLEVTMQIIDNQGLYHSKCMILEMIIMINDKIAVGELNSDYIMLNSKDCCILMNVKTVGELKDMVSKHLKKLAQNIYLMTSAADNKSLAIIAATNYIKNNYHRDLSRDDVASFVNLNPSYFSKFFKEMMGESFVSYLRRIRIEVAITYIENSQYSIREISSKVGYIDSKYFSKLFYNHTGYTPYEYRKCIVKLMA